MKSKCAILAIALGALCLSGAAQAPNASSLATILGGDNLTCNAAKLPSIAIPEATSYSNGTAEVTLRLPLDEMLQATGRPGAVALWSLIDDARPVIALRSLPSQRIHLQFDRQEMNGMNANEIWSAPADARWSNASSWLIDWRPVPAVIGLGSEVCLPLERESQRVKENGTVAPGDVQIAGADFAPRAGSAYWQKLEAFAFLKLRPDGQATRLSFSLVVGGDPKWSSTELDNYSTRAILSLASRCSFGAELEDRDKKPLERVQLEPTLRFHRGVLSGFRDTLRTVFPFRAASVYHWQLLWRCGTSAWRSEPSLATTY